MIIGIDANPMFIRQAGIGQYVANLITHMVRLAPDDEFVLYRTGMWGESKTPAGWGGNVRVVSAPKLLLWARSRLDELDVYHGTSYRLRGFGRRGSIVSIHDLAAERVPGVAPRRWGARLASEKTKRTAHRATLILVLSEHAARDVGDLMGVPREKIEVINPGVGDDYYPERVAGGREALCRRYALPRDRYVLFVGTLEPRKNVPTLVRAFGRLTRIRRSHCLVLVGASGQGIEEISDVVRGSGLDGEVVMPGYLPQEEVRRLYSYADLFVYPSLYEGFGLPPLEAMACGAPTITSNTSSLPEVVGEAALQVDPRDPEALADAMNAILEDETLAVMLRARGFDRIKQFSWERTARETLQAYRRVGSR
ncbi:MAG: glycosyltransferase family 4 protein [candidate division NC10 bacterium]|nr:glycosyltransferase family 4 protein [candidate division NC10 bacterium]